MKRFLGCLLTLGALFCLAVPVRADILWEPFGDRFYGKHREEMEYVNRYFLANGDEGFVTLWDAPGSSGVVTQYENGQKLLVYYVYQDWGLIRMREDQMDNFGWTPLKDLSLVYDHLSFEERYAAQIQDYNGEFTDYEGELVRVRYYEYPGAPEVKLTYEPQPLYREEIKNILTGADPDEDYKSAISKIFLDEEGRTWGYVGYLYGHVEGWFCLDDPGGTDFPVRQVPEVELTAPQAPKPPMVSYLPYILVAGVVAVTAGLLYWFYVRKRKNRTA